MNIKRFFGKNSKTALALVREELGEDAVILSNRVVDGGNEIMAFRQEEIDAIASHQSASFMQETSYIQDSKNTSLEDLFKKRIHGESPVNMKSNRRSKTFDQMTLEDNHFDLHAPFAQDQIKEANQQIEKMMQEMRNMRTAIESQLTEISWTTIQHRNPVKSNLLGKLLATGFSASLSKKLAEALPEKNDDIEATKWVQNVLANNLNIVNRGEDILDRGGVFALIGPTGVGKTTTTAKLAARYVMKHGTEKLGLISTDAYRIGGHEQLRIYGKILGVMVHTVKDEADLKIALNELKNKHTILIDTVGVSQRDRMVAEQVAMLSGTNANIKKLLCLNATNSGETLFDVVQAYKGRGLDGCTMTKIDESITIGSVLDVIIREKLKLFYVANGQRVPEDIEIASKKLISQAFTMGVSKNTPFKYSREDLPFVMGNTAVENIINHDTLEMFHA